jgi:nucleotide-binding universal stress UspA family protein
MKRTLLIPTNFDEYAPQLMEFCAGTHERGIVKCILLHVFDTSGMESPVIAATIDEGYELLDELAAPLRAEGIEVNTRIETGARAHEIMRVAAQDAVDVIVMGTTRKGIMQRIFEGSVSAQVAYGQKAPTLLLRDDLLKRYQESRAAGGGELSGGLKELSRSWSRQLLVPVDFSASSARAVLQCTRFEQESVGSVRLLHVLNPKKLSGQAEIDQAIAENTFRLSAFASMIAEAGMTCETVVRIGDPCEEILAERADCDGSGIVIGGGGKSGLSAFVLGSTSRAVLLAAPVPVMVVS